MLVDLPTGEKARLIGDPHLGRRFERGVPLDRRGEREKSQFAKFVAALHTSGVAVNIMVGDLFEHPHVSNAVVIAAAEAYLKAAEVLPDVLFIALAGNHDRSRELGAVGAWDLFKRILAGRRQNLLLLDKPTWLSDRKLILFPWVWGTPALDQVPTTDLDGYVAVGHWDLQSFGGDDSYICPAQSLHEIGVDRIYSGHYHIPGVYKVMGHPVCCTGSLEPFTHAEDPDGEIYVTLTLAEATDGRDLRDKFVRLELAEGEIAPEDLDCQALTTKVLREATEKTRPQDDFDWPKIVEDALKDLAPEVRDFITERLTQDD